ncbi:hypothetical protein MMC25_002979 [Agyrium rufum]|nr:hypothetical protein [Agyrium rufum]
MFTTLTTLSVLLSALTSTTTALALPHLNIGNSRTLSPRLSTNLNTTEIGFLYAQDHSGNNYDVGTTVPDPSNPYGVQPIVGLSPYKPVAQNEYKLDYSVQGKGLVRGGSDFGGQVFWIAQPDKGKPSLHSTGLLNTTGDVNGAGATPGFTFNTTGHNTLHFTGKRFGGFYGCTGLQVNGNLVLEMEFGGEVPKNGDCKRLTLGKFAGLY